MQAPLPIPYGSETILLVEDEDILRALTRQVLRLGGYTVLEATSAAMAMQISAAHAGPIHLLATDVVMPGTGGRQLAEQLRALRPELRVLYLSGYTDNAVMHHGTPPEEIHFLQKPFTTSALARKVREVLDAPVPQPTLAGAPV
jgi:two-component system, cell cycle sensor histidine kinase and response regulator CckA